MLNKILSDISKIVDINQTATGEDYLRSLSRNVAKSLDMKYVLIGRPVAPANDSIETVVVWAGEDFADNIVYDLVGTPCKEVFTGNRVCIHDRDAAILFPDDILLAQMGVESYVGAPIVGPSGDLLGLFVLLDDKPVKDTEYLNAVVEFCAGRIGAELERFLFHEEEIAFSEKLEDSQKRFSAIFDKTFQLTFILDTNGNLVDSNQTAEELIGRTTADLVGDPVWATPWWRDNEKGQARLKEAVVSAASGRLDQFESRISGLGDNSIEVDVSVKPYIGNSGAVDYLIAEARDISKLKQLEKRLVHSQKMEAVGTLAGGIAHDFNNILAGILGVAELTLMDVVKETEKENLEKICSACMRGRDLVAKLLTFSRQDASEKKPMHINDLIEESVSLMRATLPSSISITFKNKSSGAQILADPTQIQQVLMNLCTNAAHAIGDNVGYIKVEIRENWITPAVSAEMGTKVGNHISISVQDSGCGMPGDMIARIFDPFFTTKEVGKGTGLGLSMVDGILTEHDGAITVNSTEGAGTTFTLFIPELEVQETTGKEDQKAQETDTPKARIMLVEDETQLLGIAECMLIKMGYEVEAFNDSLEAWNLFKQESDGFNLIITDMAMPKLRGRELAERIRALKPELPIIAWTGFSDSTNKESALEMGFVGYLQKPATYEELSHIVNRILK